MKNEFTYYCQQITDFTKDISLISLFPVDRPLLYTAGQYIEVVLASGEILPLSIANKPCSDGHLEFHIRHDKKHILAQQFIDSVTQNKRIDLLGPHGNSTLDKANKVENILLIAGGTGFAPINALLDEAMLLDKAIHLYWGVRRPEDAYKELMLKRYVYDNKRFHYTIVLSEPDQYPFWQGATGLVHEYAAKMHSTFQDYCVFASGPYPMLKQAHTVFTQQDLLPEHFISDLQTI
jgi:CDP-4-dehydro-6-deoxyglucose reductase